MIRLFDLPLYHCRLPTSYPESISNTSKYRQKVNIFGGISFEGPTTFKVFNLLYNKLRILIFINKYTKGFSTKYGQVFV